MADVTEDWNLILAPYKNNPCILGCSGGVDSMTLLSFLVKEKFRVHVVHVNYHKRGKDSDADELLVKEFCAANSVPFSCFNFEKNSKQSNNFQEAAREFRYSKFKEIARMYKDSIIVLAHHADDQIETFFMNLVRNSGVMGLAAMPSIHQSIVRPFLTTSKVEIAKYAKENKIPWREDASNLTNDYERNRWRNEFIPFLESEIPGMKDAVMNLTNAFQNFQLELEQTVVPIIFKINSTNKLAINCLIQFNEYEQFELWRQLKQPAGNFDSFIKLARLEKGKQLNMVGTYSVIIKEKDYLFFQVTDTTSANDYCLMKRIIPTLPDHFSKELVYLDVTKIMGELSVRKWKVGDRIKSIGMHGSQLVSDIVKDAKVAQHKKKDVLVVCDSEEIHWVVGLKIGRVAVAGKNSLKIVEVSVETK